MFSFLFIQYRDGRGLTFGSKWMALHGKLFLGKPRDKGLGHIRQDLQDNYYYIKEDRFLPRDASALDQWELDSIQLAQYRDLEAPHVAKACSLVGVALVTVLVALTLPFVMLRSGPTDGMVIPAIMGAAAPSSADDKQWVECIELSQDIDAGRKDPDTIPGFQKILANCQRLQQKFAN